ncbi:hypothetical protein ACIA8O_18460 [Kitasatospora sp. NPDC051853]|uniref:effector-associated constant component EACC1 n=1 Tax=Kitasatospora sp. NPDC051853 TaxID=3364058 RepID=UPI0037B7E4D6
MEAWISVRGGSGVRELRALEVWLGAEAALRGRVRPRAVRRWRGELGVPYGVLVVAVGHGGAVAALAGSLHAFLARPHGAGVRISVSCPEGRSVELADQRAEEVVALVGGVLTAPEEDAVWPAADGVLAS